MKSDSIKNLAAALLAAQSTGLVVTKDADNPYFKSKYATLAGVAEALRQPMVDNGLSISQGFRITENGTPVLVTTLMHVSGEWYESEYILNPKDPGPQGLAGAVTYARRIAWLAALGAVADDDDDGNAASGNSAAPAPRQQPPAASKQAPAPSKPAPRAAQDETKDAKEPLVVHNNPAEFDFQYLSDDYINWLRENTGPKEATQAQAGYATSILHQLAPDSARPIMWAGENIPYGLTEQFELLLLGRTYDTMPSDFARWIFQHLSKRRTQQGPDGRYVKGPDGKNVYEDNPEYDQSLWDNLVTEYIRFIEFLSSE